MADWNTIRDYIYENKSLVLATVDSEGNPQIRHIGGYTIEDKDILFQTVADSNKVKEIENNDHVSLLFQHEGQTVPKNITVYGNAVLLNAEEAGKASERIRIRRPQIQYDPQKNVIFRVRIHSVKILDFAAEKKTVILNEI